MDRAMRVLSAAAPGGRIPSLDGIRAVSFLLVFASHGGAHDIAPIIRGNFGVTVFFFLSGFIITTLMRSEFERNGSVNVVHFWIRRALRILPPLLIVVVGAALMALVLYPPGTVQAQALAADLLFYANYWTIYGTGEEIPGLGVVWSLAVEEHFYVLFPLLYVAMLRFRVPRQHQARLLWGLCAAVLVWRCVLVLAMHATSARIYVATDTRADCILFGCALALWNNPALDKTTRARDRAQALLLPLAVAALVASLAYGDAVFLETFSYSAQGLALTCVFTCAVRHPEWLVFRLLNWRPVIFVGVLSYTLYLT